MPNRSTPGLQRLRLIALVLITMTAAIGLVYLANTAVIMRDDQQTVAVKFGPYAEPGVPGAPITSYAAVNPALIPALEAAFAYEQIDPLSVIAPNVPPIGVYLPMTGDSQLAFPTATPIPELAPLPTITVTASITPIPSPTQPATLTPPPTLDPTEYALAFGEANCAPSGWPVAGVLTQYYHWYHPALDFGVPLDTGVVATHSGIVRFAGWRTDGYGNLIIIQSGQFITYYAHLNNFFVYEGQIVTRGTVIGLSGSTGNSSGPHVHYEIRIDDKEVDPLTFEERGHPSC